MQKAWPGNIKQATDSGPVFDELKDHVNKSLAEWLCFQRQGVLSCRWPSVLTHWVLWLVSQEEWTLPAGIRSWGQHFSPLCSHTMWGVAGGMWESQCEVSSSEIILNMSSVGLVFWKRVFCPITHQKGWVEWSHANYLTSQCNFLSEGDHKNRVFREIQGWITRREGLSLGPRLGHYRIQTHLGVSEGEGCLVWSHHFTWVPVTASMSGWERDVKCRSGLCSQLKDTRHPLLGVGKRVHDKADGKI